MIVEKWRLETMRNLMIVGAMFAMSVANAGTYNSFDSLSVGYQNEDVSVSPVVEGVTVRGSKAFDDVFYVNGSLSTLNGLGVDYDTYRVGLGARVDASDLFVFPVVFYGEGYLLRDEVESGDFFRADSWGYGVEGGARAQVTERVEVRAGISGERFTVTEQWTPYGIVGATLDVTGGWALNVDARVREGIDRYSLSVQYNF